MKIKEMVDNYPNSFVGSIKSIFFVILIIVATCFMLAGCGFSNIEKKSNVELAENGISLSIKENTLTSTSVTLIYKNDSDNNVRYGEDYHIEIKKKVNGII